MRNIALFTLLAVAPIGMAHADGDAVLGKQKAEACVACHGDHGTAAKPGVPKIDRMSAGTLKAAMEKIREVHHDQPIIAHNLTQKDLDDIGAYFTFVE